MWLKLYEITCHKNAFWHFSLRKILVKDAFVGSDNTIAECQLSSDGSTLTLEHELIQCGMTMNFDSDAGKINFKASSCPFEFITN